MDVNRYLKKLRKFMKIAQELSGLSTCKRNSVGAIVVPNDFTQIYSIGYNGPVSGIRNDSCTNEQGQCGCVHAEANAIAKFDPLKLKPCILICTTAPCRRCAELIVNCGGIRRVVYKQPYRNNYGLELLESTGIKAIQLNGENLIDIGALTIL